MRYVQWKRQLFFLFNVVYKYIDNFETFLKITPSSTITTIKSECLTTEFDEKLNFNSISNKANVISSPTLSESFDNRFSLFGSDLMKINLFDLVDSAFILNFGVSSTKTKAITLYCLGMLLNKLDIKLNFNLVFNKVVPRHLYLQNINIALNGSIKGSENYTIPSNIDSTSSLANFRLLMDLSQEFMKLALSYKSENLNNNLVLDVLENKTTKFKQKIKFNFINSGVSVETDASVILEYIYVQPVKILFNSDYRAVSSKTNELDIDSLINIRKAQMQVLDMLTNKVELKPVFEIPKSVSFPLESVNLITSSFKFNAKYRSSLNCGITQTRMMNNLLSSEIKHFLEYTPDELYEEKII